MATPTPLYDLHIECGAHLVDFHGWLMPLHYGSQLNEHLMVRRAVGIFDLCHMTIVDIVGKDAHPFLRYLLANDIARLTHSGQAQYTLMLTEQGGVIDDLIAYYLAENHYRLILNASTRNKDIDWLTQHSTAFDVQIDERLDWGLLAVQGPDAIASICNVLPANLASKVRQLKPFECVELDNYFVARTGYTGEDGVEIALPLEQAKVLWRTLFLSGIQPVGLGARDTLRLEAGMNLYGQEMDETTSPLTANLGWTIAIEPDDRLFIGRDAVIAARNSTSDKLVGLILHDKGMLRRGMAVEFAHAQQGIITSGGYSPILSCSIALARVPKHSPLDASITIRGFTLPLEVTSPVFVRRGQVVCPSSKRNLSL